MIQAERAEPYYPSNDQALVAFLLPYAEFVQRFGPAHRPMDDRDNEPGPCEYWAFRFACGLSVFLVYHSTRPPRPGGYVYANRPEIDHILQHVPLADCADWRLDQAEPRHFRETFGERAAATCPAEGARERRAVPEPWRSQVLHVGGVGAVGFPEIEDALLVVSHSGLGVFDLSTFECIARDVGPFLFNDDTESVGAIGRSRGLRTAIAGLRGTYRTERQLPLATDDGWVVSLVDTAESDARAFLRAPTASAGTLIGEFEPLYAIGFSPYGSALVIAESHSITVLTRELTSPENITSPADLWRLFEVLCQSLRNARSTAALQDLRNAQRSVNGLTDGWEHFLDALRGVASKHSFSESQSGVLRRLIDHVDNALRRGS